MIQASVKFTNAAELVAAIRKAPRETVPQLRNAISRSIELVQRTAFRKAPVNKQSGGGNLRQSIKTYIQPLKGEVRAEAKYAAAVEFGSRPHTIVAKNSKVLANKRTGQFFGKRVNHPGTRAQPFLFPAVESSKREIISFFKTAMINVLKVVK